jgi:hypothetical protein
MMILSLCRKKKIGATAFNKTEELFSQKADRCWWQLMSSYQKPTPSYFKVSTCKKLKMQV